MKRLIGIIQFLTIIPINIDIGIDEEFHKSTIYFPIVGLILGICYFTVAFISTHLFNQDISTLLILGSTIILTGGLHLDGVGDTFDGLYSYRKKDKILEIMKESRLGTNAMLAILFLLLLKAACISEILKQDKLEYLILMPVVARTMQVIACYKTKTPRENGMGNIFIGKVSTPYLVGTITIAIVINYIVTVCSLLLSGISLDVLFIIRIMKQGTQQVIVAFIIFMTMKVFIKSTYKKIDGITGDILGCICEFSEMLFLLILII